MRKKEFLIVFGRFTYFYIDLYFFTFAIHANIHNNRPNIVVEDYKVTLIF